MPGFDGSGPRGNGAMTGRGRGYCVVPETELADNRPGNRNGVSDGSQDDNKVAPAYNQELDSLRAEMQSLKDSLNRIESQIKKLTEK